MWVIRGDVEGVAEDARVGRYVRNHHVTTHREALADARALRIDLAREDHISTVQDVR